jgi:hypothetical protein
MLRADFIHGLLFVSLGRCGRRVGEPPVQFIQIHRLQ